MRSSQPGTVSVSQTEASSQTGLGSLSPPLAPTLKSGTTSLRQGAGKTLDTDNIFDYWRFNGKVDWYTLAALFALAESLSEIRDF